MLVVPHAKTVKAELGVHLKRKFDLPHYNDGTACWNDLEYGQIYDDLCLVVSYTLKHS
jgi:hypothetical protein